MLNKVIKFENAATERDINCNDLLSVALSLPELVLGCYDTSDAMINCLASEPVSLVVVVDKRNDQTARRLLKQAGYEIVQVFNGASDFQGQPANKHRVDWATPGAVGFVALPRSQKSSERSFG